MRPARVVSVDLAVTRVRDIGVCVLSRGARGIDAELVPLGGHELEGPPSAAWVADACARLCRERGARLLLIDGPQAWKAADDGLAHARACERALHTPAKTGEPGRVKPRPYAGFVRFAISVFDALHERGWPRLEMPRTPRGRRALEVFPHAAWKRLGLEPLPAKAKCAAQQLAACQRALSERVGVHLDRAPSHDELQALVAGVAGLALLERDVSAYELVGEPPRCVDGHWREGFILVPRRASPARTGATR